MKNIVLALLVFCAALINVPAARAADGRDILLGSNEAWLNVTRPLTARDMRNRYILLDFWTYGCINCMQIVPDLDYLEHTFGDRLLIIGVHSAKFTGEQGDERILAAAKRFGLKHPVLNDSDFNVWQAFGVHAWPTQVLLDENGKVVGRYVGEGNRDEIEKDIAKGVKTLASAPAPVPLSSFALNEKSESVLSFPARLAYADTTPWGPLFFVADSGHNRVLGFDAAGKIRLTIGSGEKGLADGPFRDAQFDSPRGVVVMNNALYIADTGNHSIRRAAFAAGTVERVAGTGVQGRERRARNAPALQTALASPWDVEPLDDHRLAVAGAGTHQLWVYDAVAKTLSVLAGNGREGISDGSAAKAELAQPSGLSRQGSDLFFVDAESSSLRVLHGGAVDTLIGTGLFDFGLTDGTYPDAMMQHAQGLYAAADKIYVADTYNNRIRVYDRNNKTLSTLELPAQSLTEPGDVLMVNGILYIADTNNNRIMAFDPGKNTLVPITLEE